MMTLKQVAISCALALVILIGWDMRNEPLTIFSGESVAAETSESEVFYKKAKLTAEECVKLATLVEISDVGCIPNGYPANFRYEFFDKDGRLFATFRRNLSNLIILSDRFIYVGKLSESKNDLWVLKRVTK